MHPAALLIWFALVLPASAQSAEAFDNPEAFGAWVTYYYRSPEPSKVADALLFASTSGFFKDGKASPPFFGFLAGWFAQNWPLAESVVERLTALPPDDQPVLVLGLWYSATPDSKALLAKYVSRMPAQEKLVAQLSRTTQPQITDIPLEQGPWVLDALWGNFMATGSDAPIVRLLSALPWATVKGDIPRLLVGGSARWSLISNAVQHPRVLEICRAQLSRQPENVATPLAEVIREAESELRSAKKSGS